MMTGKVGELKFEQMNTGGSISEARHNSQPHPMDASAHNDRKVERFIGRVRRRGLAGGGTPLSFGARIGCRGLHRVLLLGSLQASPLGFYTVKILPFLLYETC